MLNFIKNIILILIKNILLFIIKYLNKYLKLFFLNIYYYIIIYV